MRIIKKFYRDVHWHGHMLAIPKQHNFVVADPDGRVYSYEDRPTEANNRWSERDSNRLICSVDLEGTDWRTTLEEYVKCT